MLIVFGSINMDINMTLPSFPEDGETVISNSYKMTSGGKGANQALASARTGAKTVIVGKTGDDGNGLRISNFLRRNEVMTSGIAKSDELPTGLAIVVKNKQGGNRTMVASGANSEISAEQVPTEALNEKNIVLLQMETPLEQNAIVMKNAQEHGAKVILNLAPAITVPTPVLSLVDYLIINQIEARQLAKKLNVDLEENMPKLAHALAKEGNLTCIVTLGPDGVVCCDAKGSGYKIESLKLEDVKDTTGAGDCFSGTFAACIHEGEPLAKALRKATVASGLSCQQDGTMASYPYISDVEEVLENFPDALPISA